MPASEQQRKKTAARRAEAVRLRMSGMDWQTIAAELGYAGRAAACKDVSRALRAGDEAAQALRALELARLDAMQAALWDKAMAGNPRAVDSVLRVMQRRAQLAGLDAPDTGASAVDAWLTAMSVPTP